MSPPQRGSGLLPSAGYGADEEEAWPARCGQRVRGYLLQQWVDFKEHMDLHNNFVVRAGSIVFMVRNTSRIGELQREPTMQAMGC